MPHATNLPSTAHQIAKFDRLQVANRQLRITKRLPFMILAATLFPTLATNLIFSGSENLWEDPFIKLRQQNTEELTTTPISDLNQVIANSKKTLDEVLETVNTLPVKFAKDPITQLSVYGKIIEKSSDETLTELKWPTGSVTVDKKSLKNIYISCYLQLSKYIYQRELPSDIFIKKESIPLFVDSLEKSRSDVNMDALNRRSFPQLADMIITFYKAIESNFDHNHKKIHQEINDKAKLMTFDATHYQFFSATLIFSILIVLSMEIAQQILTPNKKLSIKKSSKQDAELKINELTKTNADLASQNKWLIQNINRAIAAAIPLSGLYLFQKKDSPAYLYSFTLSISINLLMLYIKQNRIKKSEKNVKKKLDEIKQQFNKAVKCSNDQWDTHIGSTIFSSFLILSPKPHKALSKSSLNKIIENVLLKNGIHVISSEKNCLTIDPVKLTDEAASSINNEIDVELKKLSNIHTLTEQLKKLSTSIYIEDILLDGTSTAKYTLPYPEDISLKKPQTFFSECTLEKKDNMLILIGHTPTALNINSLKAPTAHPQLFQPNMRKKAKIYIEGYKVPEIKTVCAGKENKIEIPDLLKNEGSIVELNSALIFVRNANKNSHVTQDQIDNLTGGDPQTRFARAQGQSGYKLRTDGVLCYKKQNSRKRLFFAEAPSVKISVNGKLQDVPSCRPDRIVKKR